MHETAAEAVANENKVSIVLTFIIFYDSQKLLFMYFCAHGIYLLFICSFLHKIHDFTSCFALMTVAVNEIKPPNLHGNPVAAMDRH